MADAPDSGTSGDVTMDEGQVITGVDATGSATQGAGFSATTTGSGSDVSDKGVTNDVTGTGNVNDTTGSGAGETRSS